MKQIRGGEPLAIEAHAQRAAEAVSKVLPENLGFTIFVFEQSKVASSQDPTHISYVSTAERSQMLAAIRSWMAIASE